MRLIVDLHLHSHFSRATSADMDLPHLYSVGQLKGINVIGTGDFTHPTWFKEIREQLEPAESGLFQLKPELAQPLADSQPASYRDNLHRFLLTAEISTIYSRNGKVRKLHHVLLAPSLAAAAKINAQLSKIGNLAADGRPILGLDSQELLKIVLDSDPQSFLIPAHIWTPWFAMFGSKSGFDSITETFGGLAGEIKAVETGLSSDPAMNWRLSQLDGLTLVSDSDAHSPAKLGREANVLDVDLSYESILAALKTNDQRWVGTIEFFPQEGKYHFDGHRQCGIHFSPEESIAHNLICPVCGKPLVLGVDYRVNQLADRPVNYQPAQPKQVEYIIPLAEILAEINHVKSSASPKVQAAYAHLTSELGDEFKILRHSSLSEIKTAGGPVIAEAIRRLRAKEVIVQPGYDGVYGVIRVFKDVAEMSQFQGQLGLGW